MVLITTIGAAMTVVQFGDWRFRHARLPSRSAHLHILVARHNGEPQVAQKLPQLPSHILHPQLQAEGEIKVTQAAVENQTAASNGPKG